MADFLRQYRQKLALLLIFVFALGLRLLLIAAWYTDDLRRFDAGDYPLYAIGAEHFEEYQDFSNSLFLVRPPLLALVIYALDRSDFAVLIVNSLVGALLAPLTCVLGKRLGLSVTGAWLAGGLVAIDPGSVVYSAFLGPEPLANLFLLAMMIALLISADAKTARPVRWGIAAGVFLVLSMVSRPAAYLLWIGLAIWLLFLLNRHRWPVIGAFVLVSVVGTGAWVLHNGRVFHYYTFSTIAPYTMVYYHAASVEHLATGHDMDTVYITINRRVEEELGHDTTNVDAGYRQRYLSATPQVASALNSVAFEIFTAHPFISLLTIPIGFSRMYGITTNALPSSSLVFTVLERVWNTAFVAGTLIGLGLAFRRRQWLLFWCVLLMAGYFTTGTLIVKSAGMDTRERSMLVPFMAVITAYAIIAGLERWRIRFDDH